MIRKTIAEKLAGTFLHSICYTFKSISFNYFIHALSMDRKKFIQFLSLLGLAGVTMKLNALNQLHDSLNNTEKMPVLFLGHGSPMNAIEENEFVAGFREAGKSIPKPAAILCVSAHWETDRTYVTAMEKPRTIHDFGGFPQADIPHLGLSGVIVYDAARDGARERAQGLLDGLLDQAWERRADFMYRGEPLADSIARARAMTEGPVILVDHGDNTASGGTQDVMSVLEEVVRQQLDDVVAGPFCDPIAVAKLIEAGIGANVSIDVGGRVDMPALHLEGRPMALSGKVRAITDGEFGVTGPMATGARMRMGRTAVLDTGRVQVVVSEGRVEPHDLGVFTHCGIDPRRKRYVLIKSRQHFRAGFEPIARQIVECQGLGVTASDIALFDYKRRPKPLYPFEKDAQPSR